MQNETAQSSADGFSDRGRRRVRGALNWSPYCRTIATAGSSRMPTPPRSSIWADGPDALRPGRRRHRCGWLLLALPIDLLLRLSHPDAWQIYRSGEAWIDLRFYIGWSLGLLLAPSPRETAASAGPAR